MHYWSLPVSQLFSELQSTGDGLTQKEAFKRLKTNGPNQIIREQKMPRALRILLSQFKNWLIIILLLSAIASYFLGERVDAIIVISLVILSVLFGFFQEFKAEKTLQQLKKFISHKVIVKRDGEWIEADSKHLVVGDIVKLQIGDVVPADIRLLKIDDLNANESVLTGESVPVSKDIAESVKRNSQPQDITNMVFMGSTIAGGHGEGIITATATGTFFGQTAAALTKTSPQTGFQKETANFSAFLFRIILVMTIFVFLANAWLGKGAFDSFLFAIALAVGITPELLPPIMTVALSQGSLRMARKKVVVKRLMSVEDLGNIDTLCTDKTGTLTLGTFTLNNYVNSENVRDEAVLIKALLCTGNFIHGNDFSNTNPVDQALWQNAKVKSSASNLKKYQLLDGNEFDFERRCMSVLVKTNDPATSKDNRGNLLIVKGSPESVLAATALPKDKLQAIQNKISEYEENGFRVIAIAEKEITADISTKNDETNLNFTGLLLFNDPVKPDAQKSLERLQKLGVAIKVISGDSVIVTKSVIKQVGLNIANEDVISGEMLANLSEKELEQYAQKYNFFARVTPEQKYKLVASLNKEGHIVGFLGDGINDAPALKAADVGIAVNTGAPVAKEAADIILLRKDLGVLAEGIEVGRKTFGNIMKYILNTVSANFGNMFTVAISSLFLPYIPLLPKQILLNNFISDVPLFTIAGDNVDREFTKRPKRWNIKTIGTFMMYFGLISSCFDLILILPMVFLWKLPPEIFRTAWFIESSLSEILVTFAIRTKLPFYKSRPHKLLIISSIIAGLTVILIPLLGIGDEIFSFNKLPIYLWFWIGVVLLGYFALTEIAKRIFFKKYEL